MTALEKSNPITIDEFIEKYEGTRFQFHEGEVWEAQATTPDHSDLMGALSEVLRGLFHKIGGPKKPGGWWIFPAIAVRYSEGSLFSHDLAGWKRTKVPERPRKFPITERPDWVCEILSSNTASDLVVKKAVLHRHDVPYYWLVHPTERLITVLKWSLEGYVSILDLTEDFVGKIAPFETAGLKAKVLFPSRITRLSCFLC